MDNSSIKNIHSNTHSIIYYNCINEKDDIHSNQVTNDYHSNKEIDTYKESVDRHEDIITQSDTEMTVVIVTAGTEQEKEAEQVISNNIPLARPPLVYKNMQCSSDYSLSAATRQPSSMSNIDLGMHTIPPRIMTKDASYSFICIGDPYKDMSPSPHDIQPPPLKLVNKVSTRGFCNLFTILFIISIILFLFIYPFITFYIIPSTTTLNK